MQPPEEREQPRTCEQGRRAFSGFASQLTGGNKTFLNLLHRVGDEYMAHGGGTSVTHRRPSVLFWVMKS